MADIKEFVQKQTGVAIKIGKPAVRKPEPAPSVEEPSVAETPAAPVEEVAVVATPAPAAAPARKSVEAPTPGKVGRPRIDEERVKLSLYLSKDRRDKLNMLKFTTFASSVNDVIIAAIDEYIEKHKKF